MRADHRATAADPNQGGLHHLVIKRGHRGRYRFVMIAGDERIGGEIWIDAATGDPEAAHGLALARITRLAEALQAGVAIRATPGPTTEATTARAEGSSEVDESASRLQTLFGAGDHHGQV